MTNEESLSPQSAPEPTAEPEPPPHIAGFWRRLGACTVDSLILALLGLALGLLFFDPLARLGVYGRLLGFSITLLYFGILNSSIRNGQTIGKRLLRIQVVDRDGKLISPTKSFLRSAVFAIAFFINGAMIPPSALIGVLGFVINLLLFGLGGAIIYLYIFNRRTRQSMHDLIADTYVVRRPALSTDKLPLIWRGHFIVIGVWLLLIAVFFAVALQRAGQGPFPDLLKVQRSIQASGKVHTASVFVGQSYGPRGNFRFLRIVAVWKDKPASYQQAANEIAAIVLRDSAEAMSKDLLIITVAYGYDIGIARAWQSATEQITPREWMPRAQGISTKP